MVVPLCLDLKNRHARGEKVFVHPSCIVAGPDGFACIDPSLASAPSDPRDKACIAPENMKTKAPGNSRASVYSIGAILYEAVTGHSVGPGMARPKEIIPNLPSSFETLLAKALVGDPHRRPDDLGALANAMHHLAPMKSIPPPDVDVTRLDHTGEFEVDIALSMIPPSSEAKPAPISVPRAPTMPQDPFAAISAPASGVAKRNDPTAQLADLKARLEADPRPRYVVSKDRMDHGPFSAVELLQQITTNSFLGSHILRDEISGQSQPIAEWAEFAPFSDQAQLKREIVAENKAVAISVKKEKASGVAKFLVAGTVFVALAGGLGVWFMKFRGNRSDNVDVGDDSAGMDIALKGGVKGSKRSSGGGGGGGAGGGSFPSGLSYEAALNSNVDELTIGKAGGGDLSQAQLSGPLNARGGSILAECGTPESTHVKISVAVKNGHAVGVSVYPNPADAKLAGCIGSKVRGISWPSNPKMDGVHITF